MLFKLKVCLIFLKQRRGEDMMGCNFFRWCFFHMVLMKEML